MNENDSPNYYNMYWDEVRAHGETKKELKARDLRIEELETDLQAYRLAFQNR